MIRIKARSCSGSIHITTGTVNGGIPNKLPGVGTPYTSIQQGIDHLERNGWEVIEVMATYIIYKLSRLPDTVNGSYSGPTWDKAEIRYLYKPFYDDEQEAQSIARTLTRANPGVGFGVMEVGGVMP